MERLVPVWLLLLIVLIGALFTVAFGWAVSSQLRGSDRSGRFGEVALTIAEFPGEARRALLESVEEVSGPPDRWQRVPAWTPKDARLVPVPGAAEAGLTGLVMREGAEGHAPGWRLLHGTFAVEDGEGFEHRVVLLDPALRVARSWSLDEEGVGDIQGFGRIIGHGLAVLPDNSIVTVFDGGRTLQRHAFCGGRLWRLEGRYHHAVSVGPRGDTLWTLVNLTEDEKHPDGSAIAEIDAESGEILRRFTLSDIIAANPDTGILQLRQKLDVHFPGTNSRKPSTEWLFDPHHINDVEALPEALVDAFPGFEVGDLMLSLRSIDAVVVIDPDTLKLRWHAIGPWIRHHDPDWNPDGTITVFDNRMTLPPSHIRRIDPTTRTVTTPVDGGGIDFYSRIRGKHQVLPDGSIAMASAQQGRVVEVTPTGRIVFEVVSQRVIEPADYNYPLTSVVWLPPERIAADACD